MFSIWTGTQREPYYRRDGRKRVLGRRRE